VPGKAIATIKLERVQRQERLAALQRGRAVWVVRFAHGVTPGFLPPALIASSRTRGWIQRVKRLYINR